MERKVLSLIEDMGLHEIKAHVFTPNFTDSKAVYYFATLREFDHYFLDNFVYIQPKQKSLGIIKQFDDGSVLASKWICDRLIQARRPKCEAYDRHCGTCEYSYKASDIAREMAEASDESSYEEIESRIGSCCLGKTPEEQYAEKYLCDQYAPDKNYLAEHPKVYAIGSINSGVNTRK